MPDRRPSNVSLSHQLRQRRIGFAESSWRKPEKNLPELVPVEIKVQEKTVEDIIGNEVSRQRIRDLYGSEGHIGFWKFARVLHQGGNSKFCVSQKERNFETERDMRFYSIEKTEQGNLKVIYLGQGKTPFTPEILNAYAAETWGFAVLRMKEVKDKA